MIGIVTDSTCDIPQPLLDQHGIIVVPQVLIWGDREYHDRIDMQPAEFYERLAADRQPPRSSQPTRLDFSSAFANAVEHGASSIVALVLSSTLSGSIDNAKMAAAECVVPVEVIDSRATSMGLGWQVLAAARAVENGLDLRGVLERVNLVRGRIVQLAALDTLEYVRKGGRVAEGTQETAGTEIYSGHTDNSFSRQWRAFSTSLLPPLPGASARRTRER